MLGERYCMPQERRAKQRWRGGGSGNSGWTFFFFLSASWVFFVCLFFFFFSFSFSLCLSRLSTSSSWCPPTLKYGALERGVHMWSLEQSDTQFKKPHLVAFASGLRRVRLETWRPIKDCYGCPRKDD